jgi:hypothetical protein
MYGRQARRTPHHLADDALERVSALALALISASTRLRKLSSTSMSRASNNAASISGKDACALLQALDLGDRLFTAA